MVRRLFGELAARACDLLDFTRGSEKEFARLQAVVRYRAKSEL